MRCLESLPRKGDGTSLFPFFEEVKRSLSRRYEAVESHLRIKSK